MTCTKTPLRLKVRLYKCFYTIYASLFLSAYVQFALFHLSQQLLVEMYETSVFCIVKSCISHVKFCTVLRQPLISRVNTWNDNQHKNIIFYV